MIKFERHILPGCLKCGSVAKEMVKIGPMIFCHHCAVIEFTEAVLIEEGFAGNSLLYNKYITWMYKYYNQEELQEISA